MFNIKIDSFMEKFELALNELELMSSTEMEHVHGGAVAVQPAKQPIEVDVNVYKCNSCPVTNICGG